MPDRATSFIRPKYIPSHILPPQTPVTKCIRPYCWHRACVTLQCNAGDVLLYWIKFHICFITPICHGAVPVIHSSPLPLPLPLPFCRVYIKLPCLFLLICRLLSYISLATSSSPLLEFRLVEVILATLYDLLHQVRVLLFP